MITKNKRLPLLLKNYYYIKIYVWYNNYKMFEVSLALDYKTSTVFFQQNNYIALKKLIAKLDEFYNFRRDIGLILN